MDRLIFDLDPNRWPYRPRLEDGNVASGGYVFQREQLLSASQGLRWFLSETFARDILTLEEEQAVRSFAAEFSRCDLFGGPEPWLAGNGAVRVNWPRYDELFTRWGLEMWSMIQAHGFGA